jgi:hypothetical protein
MFQCYRVSTFAVFGLLSQPAEAATYWPEKAAPLTGAQIGALVAKDRSALVGNRVLIDDMAFSVDKLRLSGFSGAKWPGGTLVYDATGLSVLQLGAFLNACKRWSAVAKVKCVRRTTQTAGFLRVRIKGGSSSWSDVGYPGSKAIADMRLCCFNSLSHISHEIGHALGLSHEHKRSDRDPFVRIVTANIKAGKEGNFTARNLTTYGPYDFLSEMHYDDHAFSKNGKRTIVVRPPHQAMQDKIGTATQVSALDKQGMAARYGRN